MTSLLSTRFRRFFRPFEAFFAFWRRENWGERNRSKGEKCFIPAESPAETLATQAKQ